MIYIDIKDNVEYHYIHDQDDIIYIFSKSMCLKTL